jgi:hypothetical protein
MTLELNDTATRLLQAEAALGNQNPDELASQIVVRVLQMKLHDSKFGEFMGLWSKEDAAEFEQAIAPLNQIDEELWRD